MSYSCSDFFDDVMSRLERYKLVESASISDDENGVEDCATLACDAIHDVCKQRDKLAKELRTLTEFLEGICISTGPQAAAFTAQQLATIAHARAALAKVQP